MSGAGFVRWSVPLAMAVVVVSFVAATLYDQLVLTTDADALTIASNAGPSLEYLSDARVELSQLERATGASEYQRRRRHLDAAIAAYRKTPDYPGELRLFSALPPHLERLDRLVVAGDEAGWTPAARAEAEAIDQLLHQLLQLNHGQMASAAQAIVRDSRRYTRYAFILDGVGVLIALVVTALVTRALMRNLHTLDRRSKELEHLAMQVGHEIANPLTPIVIALRLSDKAISDEGVRKALERAERAVGRIGNSIGELTSFARSALAPTADETPAEVGAALSAAMSSAGLTNAIERPSGYPAGYFVRCAAPVLADLMSRFVAGTVRSTEDTIRIDVERLPRRVRISVASTAAATEGAANPFDPRLYDRASGHPGINLGLATVRRLVEARNGAVGVRQRAGRRVYWIALPRGA